MTGGLAGTVAEPAAEQRPCNAADQDGAAFGDLAHHWNEQGRAGPCSGPGGTGEAAAPGWPSSPKIEALRTQWFAAPDLAAQQAICRQIQLQAFEDVPYYPVGAFLQPTAYRNDKITGLNEGFATFWNVRPV